MTNPTGVRPVEAPANDELEPAETGAAKPAAPGARKPGRWNKQRIRRLLLIAGPVAMLIVAAFVLFAGGRYVGTENAYVRSDKVMVGAEVSGVIAAVNVKENQRVTVGDVLFQLDKRPYEIALRAAEAELQTTRDQIVALRAAYRQKQEERALAEANIAFAQREFDRQAELIGRNSISHSAFEASQHELDTARREALIAQEELLQIQAQIGSAEETPIESHPLYLQAQAARDKAALDLEHATVRAPMAGIASNTPEVGQQVAGNGPLAQPVMAIVADTGMWIIANFKETDLTNVRPGQSAEIRVDTYPGHKWQGTVNSINQATGAEFSIIPPQNATGNWVKVVQRIGVRIDIAPDTEELSLRAGMSAHVKIDTRSGGTP